MVLLAGRDGWWIMRRSRVSISEACHGTAPSPGAAAAPLLLCAPSPRPVPGLGVFRHREHLGCLQPCRGLGLSVGPVVSPTPLQSGVWSLGSECPLSTAPTPMWSASGSTASPQLAGAAVAPSPGKEGDIQWTSRKGHRRCFYFKTKMKVLQ